MTIYIGEKTSPTLTLRKKTVFHQILWSGNFVKTQLALFHANSPIHCGNCAFPQNFHTRKLGEITLFHAVGVPQKNCSEKI